MVKTDANSLMVKHVMYPIEVANRFVFTPEFLDSQPKCISLFNIECLPRTATMLLSLASQLCPIIGDLSVETCLPFSKTCGSVFILDYLIVFTQLLDSL